MNKLEEIAKNKKVFILCEKLNQAEAYASVLGLSGDKKRFWGKGNKRIGGAQGHLLELKHAKDYNPIYDDYRKISLPYVPEEFQWIISREGKERKESTYKRALYDRILQELQEAEVIINATDAGREGDAIFYKIYEHTRLDKKIYRVWISSMEEREIRRGFDELLDEDDKKGLRYSARGRELADWICGINATVGLTVHHGNMLNAGRVQTPVLHEIVKRSDEVENHKPQYFFTVGLSNESVSITSVDEYESEEEADKIKVEATKESGFLEKKQQETPVKPLKLFSLTTLQKEMSKKYGKKPAETLEELQKLYEEKKVTYPRTSSEYLTEDMKGTFCDLSEMICEKGQIEEVDYGRAHRCFNNKKVEDHYAIIPTKEGIEAFFKEEELRGSTSLLGEIIKRMIVQSMKNYISRTTTWVFENNAKKYDYKKVDVVELGWKKLYKEEESGVVKEKIELEEKPFAVKEKSVEKRERSKPALYTDATILGFMQKPKTGNKLDDEILKEVEGIGTPATRANILEGLEKRGYIEHKKNALIPTEKGKILAKVTQGLFIANAHETAEMETLLKEMEVCNEPEEALQEFLSITKKKMTDLVKAVKKSEKAGIARERITIGTCPMCQKGHIQEFTKGYGCTKYDEGCRFIIWKEIAKKKITKADCEMLLTKGRTKLLKGFVGKNGKKFEAYLVLGKDGKISFEFEQRKKNDK